MIERKWGMTIDERDEDGGEEQDIAAAPVQASSAVGWLVGLVVAWLAGWPRCWVVAAYARRRRRRRRPPLPPQDVLNANGVTTLCLDLIAVGIDHELVTECVKLCVAMLFKEGGHKEVQGTMFRHLNERGSTNFFLQVGVCGRVLLFVCLFAPPRLSPVGDPMVSQWAAGVKRDVSCRSQMREIIQSMAKKYMFEHIPSCEDADDDVWVPPYLICMRFLQLMCEGHHGDNQNIMREQPNNVTSINLLEDFVALLHACSKKPVRGRALAVLPPQRRSGGWVVPCDLSGPPV